jgi:UDP-glucose 4-epimerase
VTNGVLVVGGSSPLGRATGLALTAAGHRVILTARKSAAGFTPLDVDDNARVEQLLREELPSSVIYLASPRLSEDGDTAALVNGSLRALREFALRYAETGARRLVFASSAAVYGTSATTARREVDPVEPGSAYAELKLRSEELLAEVDAQTALETLALRIFNVYGAGFSQSLVNRLVASDEGEVALFDTADFVRDYIHASDVSDAFVRAVEVVSLDESVVNIGTGVATSNRDLLAMLPESHHRTVPFEAAPSVSIADTARQRAVLDFEPRVALKLAVQDPISYFRQ